MFQNKAAVASEQSSTHRYCSITIVFINQEASLKDVEHVMAALQTTVESVVSAVT